MVHKIVIQPDGQYSVWSTIVDDFVMVDCDRDGLIEALHEDTLDHLRRNVDSIIASLIRGRGESWEDRQDRRKEMHGSYFDLEAFRKQYEEEQVAQEQDTETPTPEVVDDAPEGKVVTTMRIGRSLIARIDQRAEQLGISRTAYMTFAIAKSLEQGL